MQLSAPTSSADSTLAAILVAAGRTNPSYSSLVTPGATPGEGSGPAFATILQDAAPIATQLAALNPDLAATTPTPTASATLANFPSWLTTETLADTSAVSEKNESATTNIPVVPAPDQALVALIGGDEKVSPSTVPSGVGDKPVSPGKTGRPGKSASNRAASIAGRDLPTDKPTAIPTLTSTSVTINLPSTPDAPAQESVADESGAESLPAVSRQTAQGPASSANSVFASGEKSRSAAMAKSARATKLAGDANAIAGALDRSPDAFSDQAFASPMSEASTTPDLIAAQSGMKTASSAFIPAHEQAATSSSSNGRETYSCPAEAKSMAVPEGSGPAVEAITAPAPETIRETARAMSPEVFAGLAPEVSATSDSAAASAGDSPRTIAFENSIPTQAEIFAALDGNYSTGEKSGADVSDKTFLNPVAKRVTTRAANLGTDVAKSSGIMPSATLSERAPSVAPLERTVSAPSETAVASPVSFLSSQPAVVAHRAVDAVMTAVERFSAGDRHSVHLQFSVGGADLSVRVEMRGDEVRTTFRTDSPELRTALAREWQAAAPDSADRPVKIAAPVFSSNDLANSSAFSGDTSSRQRDAQARRGETDDLFSAVASRSRAGATFAAAAHDLAAPAARAASGNALHLSTLA